jgi:transcriptional regulator with XRE-family HTH domain
MSAFLDINTLNENPLRQELIDEDEEYRYAYAEDFLNTYIATQIKVLRDEREMKQEDLAQAIGTKQSGISRLENVNYSNWKTETLKKLARAFGVRLRISFETFGSLLSEDAEFSREALKRPKFEDDPVFKPQGISAEMEEQAREIHLAKAGSGKTGRFLKQSAIRNTASHMAVHSFRGKAPLQSSFNFMDQARPGVSKPVRTQGEVYRLQDYHSRKEEFVSRNVEEKIA